MDDENDEISHFFYEFKCKFSTFNDEISTRNVEIATVDETILLV